MVLSAVGCAPKNNDFKYSIDEFADVRVMRYRIDVWDSLSFQQKQYVYHLAEAAKWGRDIFWDQHCSYGLQVRHALEQIFEQYSGARKGQDWDAFVVYAKRVFFASGIHHHYSQDKFFPDCPSEYMTELLQSSGVEDIDTLIKVMYDRNFLLQRRCTDNSKDIVAESSINFYQGDLTREEVDAFYAKMARKNDPCPLSYGLNSTLVKEDGKIFERVWNIDSPYGPAIRKMTEELEKASQYAENEAQKAYLALLIEYYKTGDLKTWDDFNVAWVQAKEGAVDLIHGFIEDYEDPLGRKATWESIIEIKDFEASRRTELISANAQWFEDHSPVDPKFKKKAVKGIVAKVINAAVLAGDCYPPTPIGVNLPNADWIRKEYGSKSVTISNITRAYDLAAREAPKSTLTEFAYDEEEVAMAKKYLDLTGDIHTDLHECLGHGSGQLLPGTPAGALGEYASCLEEARADLFGLYYMADEKLVELGILPDAEAYKAQYASYIRNGLMTQFCRVEFGRDNTEAHMQNRLLIAKWCYERGKGQTHICDENGCRPADVIEKRVKDGKTYFVVNDYDVLRQLFAELLAEVQRIKSEGDYAAGKALVEDYAVKIDPEIHKEVLERYAALNLKPYGGFVNPEIVPVCENGEVVDYKVTYDEDFLGQSLRYGKEYKTL
ncbi:MAG: dihydrofolate reductase [Bacteroidales bacterium]|nr:dihydrofolate reductase [Bacteroidales bacterium]